MTTTQETPSTQAYGLIVGGYRVRFTNYDHETFFATLEDAQEYLIRFLAYGYKGKVETIHFRVKGAE
jgi:hypothetical protein